MERPVFQAPGTPIEELDTPALVVDLDVMDRNIATVHACFSRSNAKIRPHAGRHQCPQIAHRQLRAGATAGGIGVTTVGEAEVFSEAGFGNILVANQVVTRAKIRRLCALAGSTEITVAVDDPLNVASLSGAATASGTTLGVLVELDVGLGRCGVAPGGAALTLARTVSSSPGLRFDGLLAIPPVALSSPESGAGTNTLDHSRLEGEAKSHLQQVVDSRELLEKEGLDVATVCVGGTHNYETAADFTGITELLAGSYPLMDHNLGRWRPELKPAARILASIISRPNGESAVLDAGHKATGPDRGLAVLDGVAGAKATRFSAEHGVLDLAGEVAQQLKPGDKAWLVPFDLGLCLNQYDYIRAAKGAKLEGFWAIAGRGQFG